MTSPRFDMVRATFLLSFIVLLLAFLSLITSYFWDDPALLLWKDEGELTVQQLTQNLVHHDPMVRYNTAWDIGKKKLVAAIPDLARALATDQDYLVRHHTAWALGNIGPESHPAVPQLTRALYDPDWTVQKVAARSLQKIGPGAALSVDTLQDLLEFHWWLRDLLVRLQFQLTDEKVRRFELITAAFRTNSLILSREAIVTLSSIGPASYRAIPALTRALIDQDRQIRLQACLALGKIGPRAVEASDALGILLLDTDAEIRKNAAWALAQFRSPRTLPLLLKAMKDQNVDVRTHAAEGLGKLGTRAEKGVYLLIEALSSDSSQLRQASAKALQEIATPQAKETLAAYIRYYLDQLQSNDWSIKQNAARALEELDNAETKAALKEQRRLYPDL